MTFLNPAALWGFLALAVPIVVHFFNLQRPRQVLFSNVQFVKEVKRTVVKRLSFQRWLLLLLRLLALTAIVLMFANPVLVQEGGLVKQGTRSVVVVIDNSLSMSSGNERGEYLPQALSVVRKLIKGYGPEDEFLVTTTSSLALRAGFIGSEEAQESLGQLELEQNTRSLAEVLSVTDALFERANGVSWELFVLSDFQRSTILSDSIELTRPDSNLQAYLVPLATRVPANVYVADHEVTSRILEVDQPVTMKLDLVNDGEEAVTDLNVRVLLDDKVAAIGTYSLEPESSTPVELTFTPGEQGWQSGYIELDDQPIDFDNRRYFSLYVPGQEKVLLIESESSPNLRILYEEVFTQFDTRIVSDRALANVDLTDYQSIIWSGLNSLSTGLSDQLQRYLRDGGSILIFPGADPDLSSWNQFLDDIQVGSIKAPISVEDGLPASNVDLQHPVFAGMFTRIERNAGTDPIQLFKYLPLSLSGEAPQSKIISLENQQPVLLESQVGNGQLYLFSMFPGDAWTDLHVKTLFPPLMYRLTQLMNQTGQVNTDQVIGDTEAVLVDARPDSRIDLVDAAGQRSTPERYDQLRRTRLIFDRMDLAPGNYQILQGDSLLRHLSFNIADQESRLAYAEDSDLSDWLANRGWAETVTVAAPDADRLVEQVQYSQQGWPLWQWFLLIALICLFIEVLVIGGLPGRPPKEAAT